MTLTRLMIVLAVAATWNAQGLNAQSRVPTANDNAQYKNSPCTDPWIGFAYVNAGLGPAQGRGNSGDCDISFYRGGRWSNYQELYAAVTSVQNALRRAGYAHRSTRVPQGTRIELLQAGRMIGFSLIGQDGASLIGKGGAGIVAAGGGNYRVAPGSAVPIGEGLMLVGTKLQ